MNDNVDAWADEAAADRRGLTGVWRESYIRGRREMRAELAAEQKKAKKAAGVAKGKRAAAGQANGTEDGKRVRKRKGG